MIEFTRIASVCLFLTTTFIYNVFAQSNTIKNKQKTLGSASKINCIVPQTFFDIPLLDQAKRFGLSNKIGAGFYQKKANNWVIGASFNFIFGSKIEEDSFVWNVKTPQGDFLTKSGNFQGLGFFQRGYTVGLEIGKILPVWQINANSGLLISSQIGYLRYKINIFDRDNNFPQFSPTYKKGYDRLTSGVFGEAFAGYMYFSKRKKANIVTGFNFLYGATKGQRNFLYDVARSGLDNRKDATIGFRFGWIIPIYKKEVEEKYY
jgi:hypothetical protein